MVPSRSAQSSAVITLVALAAEQHDLVAHLHRGVRAAVDHQLVHRHHAHDRAPQSVHEHLAPGPEQPAWHTVGVAEGHRRHHRGAIEPMTPPVGDAVARRDRPHVADPGLQGHRGTELGRHRGHARRRCEPVDRDAGPHERVARRRMGDGPRRVGGVDERHVDARGEPARPARRRRRRAARRSRARRARRPPPGGSRPLPAGATGGPAPAWPGSRRRPGGRRRGACRCRASGGRRSPHRRPRRRPPRRRCRPGCRASSAARARPRRASTPAVARRARGSAPSMPASRSSIPSSTSATHNPAAPASSAARATGTAPWP